MCRNPKYTCIYSSRWTYRAAECASWIMYEGHRTHLLLDVVIRRGDVQSRKQSVCSACNAAASLCGVYLLHTWLILSRLVLFSPSAYTEDDPANIYFWMDDCDCESKPLPVFLQPFGLLACLRVLIHQVKPWCDAFVLLSFHL